MRMSAVLTITAGAALLAACGQQGSAENEAASNVVQLPPANMAAPLEPQEMNQVATMKATEETTSQAAAPVEDAEQPKPKTRSEAPRSSPAEPPVQRPAEQAAPKPEPSPTPASTCTPEHEAMGHCKR